MDRLRLELDALRVETFAAAGRDEQAGVARTPLCSAVDACPTRLCEPGVR